MITPDPIPLKNESGRLFAIELGQNAKVLIEEKREEAAQLKE